MRSHGNGMDLNEPGCPDSDTLYAFADGALEPEERGPVERHVESCAICRQRLHEAGELQRLSDTLARTRLNQRDYERIERCTDRTLAEDARRRESIARPPVGNV